MKLEAIGQVALSKIHHLFSNVHIPKKALYDINNKTVQRVREWFGLSTHTTRDFIFHSKREGGLGVPDIEWTYISTHLSHLLNMLNSDDRAVRELARASLILHLEGRKVPKHQARSPPAPSSAQRAAKKAALDRTEAARETCLPSVS